jgi:hypothetical protein
MWLGENISDFSTQEHETDQNKSDLPYVAHNFRDGENF